MKEVRRVSLLYGCFYEQVSAQLFHCRWFRHAALVLSVCHVYWPGLTGSGPCATPAKIEERQSVCVGNIHKLMQVRLQVRPVGKRKM